MVDKIRGERRNEWRIRIPDYPFLKKGKIKRDLIKILRRNDFKRSFWKYPASEVYVKGDIKAKVYSKTEHDFGSEEHGIPPYDYGIAEVEIDGPIKGLGFDRIKKELHAYYEKQEEKAAEKRKRKTSGIESRIAVFILFVLGGIALSISSLTATGNAISNLTGTSQGLLGIFLFIAGLVGMSFYFRKR